jgi:RNAse (barnase) inhibitor barstar
MKPVYEIDGARFGTLEEFFDEVTRVLSLEPDWGHSFDAFHDVLRGAYGGPEAPGFTVRWKNARLSRQRLGHPETARQLELRLARCQPDGKANVARQLADARRGSGPTVFQRICEIIATHGRGGTEAEDRVELVLE